MKAVRHNFLGLICLVALTFFPGDSRLCAQDTSSNTEEHHYWVNVGGGFSWVHSGLGEYPVGFSGGISFSYQMGSSLISIRGVANAEFEMDLWGNGVSPASVWDVGVLYGRATKATHGLASISGGIGLVGVSDDEISSFQMGIPIEGQLFWTPNPIVGIGIYGFANLNSEKSFVGALLCLQIGKLR